MSDPQTVSADDTVVGYSEQTPIEAPLGKPEGVFHDSISGENGVGASFSSRQLLSQLGALGAVGCCVGICGRNAQLQFRARIKFTPYRQLAAHQFGPFAHPTQAVVSGTLAFVQELRINAYSIIPNPQAKLPFVIPEFDFDLARLGVLECIAHCFAGNPVDFVSQYRMQVP